MEPVRRGLLEKALECYPVTLAAGDLDKDGDLEIAVMDGESGVLELLMNRGQARFEEGLSITLEPKIYTLTAAILTGTAAWIWQRQN